MQLYSKVVGLEFEPVNFQMHPTEPSRHRSLCSQVRHVHVGCASLLLCSFR